MGRVGGNLDILVCSSFHLFTLSMQLYENRSFRLSIPHQPYNNQKILHWSISDEYEIVLREINKRYQNHLAKKLLRWYSQTAPFGFSIKLSFLFIFRLRNWRRHHNYYSLLHKGVALIMIPLWRIAVIVSIDGFVVDGRVSNWFLLPSLFDGCYITSLFGG